MGDLAHALVQQWKRLVMAYSPPSSPSSRSSQARSSTEEEQEGQFLSDLSYTSEEEEMGKVVAVPLRENSPTNSSDNFDFT